MSKWGEKNWGSFKWGDDTGISYCIDNVAVNGRGLNITDILGNEINTASFEINGLYSTIPTAGKKIEIYFLSILIFGGRITSVQPEKLDSAGTSSQFIFTIECSDWQIDLDKKLVVEQYTNKTLSYIVNDIITNYTTGFTQAGVITSGNPTLNGITFNYQYVSECFAAIAEKTGWNWYMDYNKDLHFFPREVNTAPIELIDNATNFDDLSLNIDCSQIVNRVYIRGGYYLSATYTQDTITVVGSETSFNINYMPHSFAVTVNGVSKTVGIENIDATGGHNFLLNAKMKLLKKDTITLAPSDTIAMTYKYEIPLLTMVEDNISQGVVASIQGGDGVIEKTVNNQNINDQNAAKEFGYTELLKYKNALVEGSFTTLTDGFRTGQLLHINLTDRNINEYYLVQEVNIELIAPNMLLYTVNFATFIQGFNWLLIKILDKINESEYDENEVIDRFTNIYEDNIVLSDTTTTEVVSTFPYKWGDATTTPARQGYWNKSKWG